MVSEIWVVTCVMGNELSSRRFDGNVYLCTRCVCAKLSRPSDRQDLWQRITVVFAKIYRDILKRVWEEFNFRLGAFRIRKSSQIEQLRKKTCNNSFSDKVNFVTTLLIFYGYIYMHIHISLPNPVGNCDTPCILLT